MPKKFWSIYTRTFKSYKRIPWVFPVKLNARWIVSVEMTTLFKIESVSVKSSIHDTIMGKAAAETLTYSNKILEWNTWAMVAMVSPKARAIWTISAGLSPETQDAQPKRTRKSVPTNSAVSMHQISPFLAPKSSHPNTFFIFSTKSMKQVAFIKFLTVPGNWLVSQSASLRLFDLTGLRLTFRTAPFKCCRHGRHGRHPSISIIGIYFIGSLRAVNMTLLLHLSLTQCLIFNVWGTLTDFL